VAVSVRFADFELYPARFELRRAGKLLKLERMPMDLLILLVEKSGQVVTREEIIGRLWGNDVFLDTEHGINTAVRKVRQVLRDNPEQPRFLLTVTGKGYRFIADVAPVEELSGNGNRHRVLDGVNLTEGLAVPTHRVSAETITEEVQQPPIPLPARSKVPLLVLSFFIVVGASTAAWLVRTPLPAPRIVRNVQLTSDGLEKGSMATDGLRIYFSERVQNHWRLFSISVSGGEVIPMHTPFQDAGILGMSPDNSELLVYDGSIFEESPLWILPLGGGSPRRLGNLLARGAAWSPDGKKLAYVKGNDIYIAKPDGTEPHKLPLVNSDPAVWPWLSNWSPDGGRLRFDRYTMNRHTCALWEFTVKDGNVHRVFSGSETSPQRCMGVWTRDGKYYLFQSWEDLVTVPGGAPLPDIWAIREESRIFHKASREPVQLTVGPVHFHSLTPSSDGKAIFAVGEGQPRGELTHYDAKTQRLLPYLSGISAEGLSFSQDGAWMAYVKFPQGELWRSKPDGSEALQLTFPPLVAYGPSWSPDGKRIAFCGQKAGTVWQPYVVAADGSTQPLLPEGVDGNEPTWSPDGNSLLLGPMDMSANPNVRILDLNTHGLTVLPGSEGMGAPRWSPDGQHISAISLTGEDKLFRFDLKTQKWTVQARMDGNWQRWSRNGKYIYFPSLGRDPGVFRVAISNNKTEKIFSLKGFRPAGRMWFNLGPKDDPLLLRDITVGSEIYALHWEAPELPR
jgi:Tol biopolymer transport system component/DNA-binding winged helix-turn-helix (wHTH) protein